VCYSEVPAALTKCFQTKSVVIEVHKGETQAEAWQRHLMANPRDVNAYIKIFHYPDPAETSTKEGKEPLGDPSIQKTGRNMSWLRI
jgi:hypothetical protein